MSFLRTRLGRERPRRPLWRDLLPIVFLALTILFATTRPFRAEASRMFAIKRVMLLAIAGCVVVSNGHGWMAEPEQ